MRYAVLPKGFETEMIYGVASEARIFLGAAAVGAVTGLLYELLRVFRRAVSHNNAAVFAEDFLYALICGAVYFVYVTAAAWGSLRGFVLVGMMLGMLIERLVIGNLAVGAAGVIACALRKAFGIVRNAIKSRLKFVQISKVFRKAGNREKNA